MNGYDISTATTEPIFIRRRSPRHYDGFLIKDGYTAEEVLDASDWENITDWAEDVISDDVAFVTQPPRASPNTAAFFTKGKAMEWERPPRCGSAPGMS